MKKRTAASTAASATGKKRTALLSHEWIDLIAAQVGEAVAVADLKGKIIFVNRAWARMHGHRERELIGKNLKVGHTAKQLRDEVIPFNQKVIAHGKWTGEVGHVRKDGTAFITEMTTTVFRGTDKKPIGIIGFARDITERTKLEASIRESEGKFRSLAETSPSGIFAYQEKFIYVNPACLELTGYSKRDLLNMPFWQLVHPDFREMVKERGRARQRGEVVSPHYEFKVVRKDGAVRWVDFAATLIQFGGRPAGMGIISDITERKTTEDQLKQSVLMYQTLVEGMNQALIQVDNDDTILFVNREFVRMFGYTERELLGKTGYQILFDAEQQALIKKKNALRRRKVADTYQLMMHRKDGSELWVQVSGSPLVDTKGAVVGSIGVISDITPQRRAEEQLRHSEEFNRSIIENSPIGFAVRNKQGQLLMYNKAWVAIWAMTPERIARHTREMTSASFRELFDHLGQHFEQVRKIFSGGGSLFIPELRIEKPNPGGASWIRQYFYTVYDQRGDIERIVALTDDITERKTAEQQLRESEGLFKTLARISPVGIFRTDAAGSTTYVNPRWCEISGLPAPDAMGAGWLSAVHPDDREPIINGWKKSVSAQNVPPAEYRFLRPDGSIAWVIGQALPERNQQGRIAGYVGTITDITDRKLAEELLRESEAKFKTLFDNASDAIFIMDSTTFLDCNRSTEGIFCCTRDQIVGHSPAEFSPERQPDGKRSSDKAKQKICAALSGDPQFFEWVHTRLDRTPFEAEVTLNRVLLHGSFCLQATVRDITGRKRAEEKLKASEAQYRQIFDGIVEGVYRTTPDGRVLMANPALIRMLGYGTLEELSRINLARDGYADPDNRRRFLELLDRDGEVTGYESRWRRKDGSIITISENARAVKATDGTTQWYEGTVEDITENVQANLALLDEKDKLAQLFAVSLSVARAGSIQEQLDLTIKGLADLRLFNRMVIVFKDDDGRNTHVAQIGLTGSEVEQINAAPPVSDEAKKKILNQKYRISNSYLIPHDDRDVQRYFSLQIATNHQSRGEWDPDDNLLVPMLIKEKLIGYLSVDDPVDGQIPSLEVVRLVELYANQAAISVDNMRLYQDLEQSYYDTLKAFVAAMEAKDPYTKGHSENVQRYAMKIARHLGLPDDRIRLIDFSSLLHDIGKMGVKEDILAKPAALSVHEYEEVKQHPAIGSLMVSTIENLSVTGPIIKAHHEYYDGSGYPNGIKGDQIPIESRIISVADAFEAMTSDRPYRKAFGYREALQRLEQASGTQFDSTIVSAFVEMTTREGESDGQK